MSPAAARGRVKRSPGALQWIALVTAGAVIMALTFTLGVLVGRQWSRPPPATASVESLARKSVPPGKRGGLSGADVEPPPSVDQKLTFYQTLTAPLGRGSADASQRAEDKAKAQPALEPAPAEPPPPPYPYTSRGETIIEWPATTEAAAAPAPPQADPAGLWSVQVAAFRTQAQADTLQKQLEQAGFDAYVAAAAAGDGRTNYRVRVGAFTSKVDAERMVERLRGERSPAAFVTPR
ncbi:MAG: SPOR domain-containing protein [Gemmatimonadales bacterium]